MKTTVVRIAIVIFAALAAIFVARFVFGGPEDTWICSRGAWVMHGKPAAPKPTFPCAL